MTEDLPLFSFAGIQADIQPAPIRPDSSFESILGKNGGEYPEPTRRKRWAEWLRAARKDGQRGRQIARDWQAHECHGCKHRNGAWCDLEGLPCTVNPILSFRSGMVGMACMGMGWEAA